VQERSQHKTQRTGPRKAGLPARQSVVWTNRDLHHLPLREKLDQI
jgi:hypothetical protein